ncbi:MAG: hypothetical protein Q4C91_09135 [Eubacteriales bacterium]|nr:hypothetical protein [Eubacteriales bacterium]
MVNDSKSDELYVMMYTMQTLHNRGITIKETVYGSLKNLLQWYRQSQNREYLDLAVLHMQAYANMGFALDERIPEVKELLELTGREKNDFYPKEPTLCKCIKVNRVQVRRMIGKWKPSKENPMSIGEVVDDIIEKINSHSMGRYIYQYGRKHPKIGEEPEVYELVINEAEAYFYDVKNFKFYTFLEE